MSVANNQTGAEGNKFEFIAKNQVTTIGMGCPNMAFTLRKDNHGNSMVKSTLSMFSGSIPILMSLPSSSVIDTSINHPQGTWSLYIANKWTIDVGSGGISLKTSGPISFASPHIVLAGEDNLHLHAGETVHIKSGKIVLIESKKAIFKNAETYFNNVISTTSNVIIGGGLYVKGECFISHMTCQGVGMTTKSSGPFKANMNPFQSYSVKTGNSIYSIEKLGINFSNLILSLAGQLPQTPGFIDTIISLPLPKPIDSIINVPAKIAFPRGIQLISDSFHAINPAMTDVIWETELPLGTGALVTDVVSPFGHKHDYVGPAVTYKKDTVEAYKAAFESGLDKQNPVPHEPPVPGGLSQIAEMYDGIKEEMTESAKNAATQLLKNMGCPFPF